MDNFGCRISSVDANGTMMRILFKKIIDSVWSVFQPVEKVDRASAFGKGSKAEWAGLFAIVDDSNGSLEWAKKNYNVITEKVNL